MEDDASVTGVASVSVPADGTVAAEIARRRTFAIISHPDAGKTTLTEKLLLYGGALNTAGAVAAKAGHAHTASDWMSLEQARGISISSSALQFDYGGCRFNLLDTPGHQDFSEDTYRTLTAADSAVMLLDAARGVQAQTERLFTVCRRREIPIFTFINKLDRPAQDPFALLEALEHVLGIAAVPFTWPIGDGPNFRGVFERATREVHLFERTVRNAKRAPLQTRGVDDPQLTELLGRAAHAKLVDEVAIVDGLIPPFDFGRFRAGEITPVFFGSVLTGFGVQEFLTQFRVLAPSPQALHTTHGLVPPEAETFSAFIFKLQANMNRHHRDSTAYARVTSGRFTLGMNTVHTRTKRTIKLSRAHTLFAQERQTVDAAYPGDIIGLVNPGVFRIGDVISDDSALMLPDFPRFAPETFVRARPLHTDKRKAFRKGLERLAEEGVVQVFYPLEGKRDPILGAVGQLQFEVFAHRLAEEYNVVAELEPLPYTHIRWLQGEPAGTEYLPLLIEDDVQNAAALFRSAWELERARREHPQLTFLEVPEMEKRGL